MRDEYLALVKLYHEAGSAPNADVLQHVTALYQQGQKLTVWVSPTFFETPTTKGSIKLRYHYTRPFEFGTVYYTYTHTLYHFHDDDARSIEEDSIHSLSYPDDKIKTNMLDKVPSIASVYFTEDGKGSGNVFHHMGKDRWYPLREVNIERDPRHVAWILNRIYDTVCYLHLTQGLTHNNILLDSLIVNPKNHQIQLHGWWYPAKVGDTITKLPRSAFSLLPPDMKTVKVADTRLDLALIKALGRELLGDRTGMTLVKSPIVQFLRSPTTGNAYEDFVLWEKAQSDQYGPRKFIELKEPT